ncbi:MAG: hypothetical protein IIC02_06535 [Planctomycetes bacterium]|nr:hypothetical protein [Planctomycetota bacterium]
MNPRYVAFATLTVLSVFFLAPTGNSGMAASAALRVADALWDASAPIVESADSRSAQSDKSQRQATPVKRDVAPSPSSAPNRTSASSGKISNPKPKLLPANIGPQVVAEGAADVLPDAGTIGGECGESFPACDGPCVVGGVCRANTVAGGECVCVKNGVPCGQSSPACDGECSLGEICRANIVAGRECVCVPVDVDCGQSQAPECNGQCPNPEDICTPGVRGGACICQPPPEEDEACCLENGRCLNLLPSQCRLSDGAPRGPRTACQGDSNDNGIDDACEFDQPCDDCGGGGQAHWVDNCPAGTDYMPTGAVVGIDFPPFDCLVDTNLVLTGAALVGRAAGTPHSIDTEIISMTLTGGGAVLRAGAGGGVGPGSPLPASLGLIVEQDSAGVFADSSFKVLFEIDLGGGVYVYNQTPLTIYGKIDCVPPDRIYTHFVGCLPLFDSPTGGLHVANLTSANHDTYPPENCPLPFPTSICADLQKDDCVGTPNELCLPRVVRVIQGGVEPIECSCFGIEEGCGPIEVDPGGDLLSCPGPCPNPNEICRIFVDGNPTNFTSAPSTAFPPGSLITCDCPKPPPDPHITLQGTSATFGAADVPAIPPDFFFPGSPPFVGTVNLIGGPTDTLGQRDGPIVCPGAGFPLPCDSVGVELVQLDLVSASPINVGGTLWDVEVALSPTGSPPLGTLDATQTHSNGGAYDAVIPFVPVFTSLKSAEPPCTEPWTTTLSAD